MKKNYAFQFANNPDFGGVTIFEDKWLISKAEAMALYRMNETKFIHELQDGNRPVLTIWENVSDDTMEGDEILMLDDSYETDGIDVFKTTKEVIDIEKL